MEKGIYKRGSIYWISYAGIDGRIIRESSGSTAFKDAEALRIQRKQAVREGKQPEIKRIMNHNSNELVEPYLIWAERQRSFRSKRGFIKQLAEAFGNVPLRRFNSMLVEQYQTERLQKGNKPATVNRLVATLKHMFTKAVEWDMVEDETLKRVRKAKLLEENNRRLRYLSEEECQILVACCNEHLRPIVMTALCTGMRKGEILGLKWESVDLRHGLILLEQTKNGERREIPFRDNMRSTFQNVIRRLDVPYVFHDPATGKPYQDVKKSFNTALGKAEVRNFHFHDLRHTFASRLAMAGIDLATIKELLGHKTITMTLRYAHLAPAHKAKAVEMMDSIFNEKSTAQKVHNLGAGGGIK
ncbi:MAG: site-specific integrase [Thermodesulfobacteriota bacterium]